MSIKKLAITRLPVPYEHAISIIGGKWHSRLLNTLNSFKELHYAQLRQSLDPISDTVLSATLREFINEGVIEKTEDNSASVVYRLTPKGKELIPVLRSLARWANTWKADTSSSAVASQPQSQTNCAHSKENLVN